MALLVFAILDVMCCYFCYFVGTQKGYNGPLCAFAGLFGSFLACLILLLMPDKASDTFNSAAYNREVSELRQQVKDLQRGSLNWSTAQRRQIDQSGGPREQAKDEPIAERSASRFGSPPEHRTRSFVLAAGSGNRGIGTAATPAGCHSTTRMNKKAVTVPVRDTMEKFKKRRRPFKMVPAVFCIL